MLQSLRSRLLLAFLVPALVLFAVTGAVGYAVARQVLEEELGKSLSAIAATSAADLSGERLLTIEPGDDVNATRTFRHFKSTLEQVQLASGARRVFAFDLQGRLRADSAAGLPVGAEVPELFRDRPELARVFEGRRAHSQVMFEGSDGVMYKTGYAPIRAGGQVVGAVGVEGSAAFFGPLRSLFRGFLALGVGGLVVIGLLALATARALTSPLRRLMEAALRIGHGDLATRVPPEGTLEIGTLAKELEAMRIALESRDRQLKMMLAGVAHEVRNPMGGIELFAGLLREELSQKPASDEALSHVARIQGEIEYLKRIVEEFLAFARERPLQPAPVEASAWVGSAARLVHADAAQKQVSLHVEAEPATVHGDEALLVAALGNVVKNAVQASPDRGDVRIRGQLLQARYRVEVEDGGPGIGAELQEKVFEPFFTTREKGTGLGLPLARKIAQAHQGALTVSSSPGRTVFTLELPARR